MKKNVKKITTLLMASVFVVSFSLSACTPQKPEEPADEYAVILNYNDDNSRPHVVYVEKGASMEAPAVPSREGYEFANWSIQQADGTELTFPYTPTNDIILYAQWEAAKYDVTFDYNFEGSTPYVESVEYNKTVSAPDAENLPEYDGHYFYHWETKAEGGTAVNFPYTVKKDVTFYAAWLKDDVKIYTVSFDANYEGAKEFNPIQVVGGQTVAEKEYSVLLLGIGTALRKLLLYSELLVVIRGCTLERHKLTPELIYFLVLREETVSAEVHSVSVITRGTRNTADIFAFLKNDRLDVGLLEKLVSGCQTRGTRADDYCCFLVHSNRTPCLFIYYRRKKPKKVSSFPKYFFKNFIQEEEIPRLQAFRDLSNGLLPTRARLPHWEDR